MAAVKPGLLVLTSTYPRWAGDTEPAFVHELCRQLAPRFDLCVVAPHAAGAQRCERMDGVRIRRFRYLPGRWQTLAYEGGMPAKLRRQPWRLIQVPFFLAALFLTAWLEARRRRPEFIHAHWLIPQGLIAVLLRAVLPWKPAVVCTAHGADLYTQRGHLARRLKSWTLRRTDALCVVSRAMLAPALALGARPAAVEVASMGADLDACFVPGDGDREHDCIIFAGRLVEKKGVPVLLDALSRMGARRPRARLVIAGEGPERARLQERARELGVAHRVEFLGAVSRTRLAELYRSAVLAAFPFVIADDGDQEGFGLVVIEAQGCACPVIVSDVPAVRDTVVDGETGLVVPMGDAAALADRIEALLADPGLAQRLGMNGRRAALQHYGWSAVAGRYARILQDARARSRAA
jgi:glycosyltransferase involved in cell wall biosynthesis